MAALDSRLQQALEEKRGTYEVRTQYKDNDGEPRYTNRLILEDSPYLLQHAHNPVNWYGWGDDAFAAARAEDKPVFLSIGYSTCHWCHVMEEESFDNEDVAALLNEHFIAIKVDREQRPDIDEIYMTAVQLITQRGGWPMSTFLTPEGKPFFGGTYYQREQFMQLLGSVAQAWHNDRPSIERNSGQLQQAMQQQLVTRSASEKAGADKLRHVVQVLRATEDPHCGGFGEAPKFPNESALLFMLDQLARGEQPLPKNPLWQPLQRALFAMLQGGIYDQVGGGFHRYATDRNWLVPHFEKMLYNQAQLGRVYARAWQLCGFPEYRRITEETLDYVLRELRAPEGGFYSATDADSEGEEGKFFVWRWEELAELLSDDELLLAQQIYGVTREGNFEGANVLFLPQPLFDAARQLGIDYEQLCERLTALKHRLYAAREHRVPPLRDDKIITEWNGMMIIALAEAGRLFGREDYVEAAAKAAAFIHQHSRDGDRLLLRCNLHGRASVAATLEDYSNWLEAMLALYDASGDALWLQRAQEAERDMLQLFGDDAQGGFYNSRADSAGPLIIRSQSAHDGATPAGNSVALVGLVALNRRDFRAERAARIEQHWLRFSGLVDLIPAGLCYMLTGIAEQLQPAPAALQYAAGGKLRIEGTLQRREGNEYQLALTLTIAPGWHINAAECPAGQTPTALSTTGDSPWQLALEAWPAPSTETPGFSEQALPLYQGAITVRGRASAPAGTERPPLALALTVQPCSDDECLQPETVTLLLHPH